MMMRPNPCLRIAGKARRVVWKAEVRLMARTAFHFSVGNSSSGLTNWMPALFTRMSRRPKVRSVMEAIVSISSGLVISAAE